MGLTGFIRTLNGIVTCLSHPFQPPAASKTVVQGTHRHQCHAYLRQRGQDILGTTMKSITNSTFRWLTTNYRRPARAVDTSTGVLIGETRTSGPKRKLKGIKEVDPGLQNTQHNVAGTSSAFCGRLVWLVLCCLISLLTCLRAGRSCFNLCSTCFVSFRFGLLDLTDAGGA